MLRRTLILNKNLRLPPWHFYLLVFLILSLTVFPSHLAFSSPAPTPNRICEPGGCNTSDICTDNIWLDGTTPIDTRNHLSQLVGTAGQDMGAFLNPLIANNLAFCFAPQQFTFSTTLVLPGNKH